MAVTTDCAVVVGTPYSFFFTASGGTTPYYWQLVSGSFPPGLFLNGETGELAGIPTAFTGTYTFVVSVTDFAGNVVYVSCRFTAGTMTITECPC